MTTNVPGGAVRGALRSVAHCLRTEPVACQGVLQAGLAAMVGFGLLAWTAEQTGLVLALSAAIFGVLARSQVTPKSKAEPESDPDAGAVDTPQAGPVDGPDAGNAGQNTRVG